MNKNFYDICYEILSHYLHFPDVADTYKSIIDGLNYQNNFPWNTLIFPCKKDEIIAYIEKVRWNNVIDAYREKENPLLLVPVPSGKKLSDADPEELYQNLIGEIPRLILKGTHQVIKHLYIIENDNRLTAELLRQDVTVLQKYKLLSGEDNRNGQA